MVGSFIKSGLSTLGRLAFQNGRSLSGRPSSVSYLNGSKFSSCQHIRSVTYQCSPSVFSKRGATVGNIPSIGVGARNYVQGQPTKGDDELLGFLKEEIGTESKMQRIHNLPEELDGFKIKLDKAEVTLEKKVENETIVISANVNHSVDSTYSEENQVSQGGKDSSEEMHSRPNFEVELQRGSMTLSFSCSFIQPEAETGENQEEFNDLFAIDEIGFSDGTWTDKEYIVAGDILDGYMYDLLMNMLEDRGISNEFAEKFSEFCTDYEHRLYVGLLESMRDFLTKK